MADPRPAERAEHPDPVTATGPHPVDLLEHHRRALRLTDAELASARAAYGSTRLRVHPGR